MKRISYLLLTFSIILGCSQKQSDDQSASQPNVGLQLYSLRNEFAHDVPGTLDKIKEMGFQILEGTETYGYSPVDFKAMLDERGFSMVSIAVGFKDLASNIQNAVELAKTLGADNIMCPWIPHSDTFKLSDIQNAAYVFNEAGKIFSEHGISFYYHMHGYEFTRHESGTLFDYLANNTDPKYVNFEMDVFWVKQAGVNPVELLQKYPERFHMFHLKDRAKGIPDSINGDAPDESNVVLGTGDVGIAAIIEQAKTMHVKYYFIEDESPVAASQIPESVGYLKTLF